MPKRNNYSPFESRWSREQWNQYCPNFTYRIVGSGDYPDFLPAALVQKFNCAVVMASGNNTNQTYVFQGFRVDGTEIDEHQYIVTYDLKNGHSHAGFVDHAHYDGRTTEIPADMQTSIGLSGVDVDYRFPRKPPKSTGSISELISGGLISGFMNSIDVQNKKDGAQ